MFLFFISGKNIKKCQYASKKPINQQSATTTKVAFSKISKLG
jgi:hypothetical protein